MTRAFTGRSARPVLKTDTSGVTVPDLVVDPANNSVDWTTACTVDPTTDNGDLWTTAWATNTLAHFSADTHQPIDLFPFADPDTGLDTPLAAIARAAGVPALPQDVIGAAVDDPLTPIDETIPAIVSTEQIVFATDGQFFVGAGQPSQSSDLGLGHGYLLRFKYDAAATNKLTLTGWWQVDAGALADRSAIRAEILNDPTIDQHDPAAVAANQLLAAQYVDGTSNGATGADELDLSSDQHTIFYTSEDNFLRVFDISSAMGTSQSGQLPSIELTDENGNSMPLTRAYGVRALPGTWTDASTPQPADGSNGFLVATSDNIVYRVDRTGKVIARYPIPGRPAALSLSPDAQYFWTATTQDDPTLPTDNGGHVFRIHIASGTVLGPYFPFGSGQPVGHGVYGLCVKREFVAGNNVCFAMNADGTPTTDPATPSACKTPTVCAATVRGVALQGDPADCVPPETSIPRYPDQVNAEGDSPRLDLAALNPGLVITSVAGVPGLLEGLPVGLTLSNGVISGTIGREDCQPTSSPCVHHISIGAHGWRRTRRARAARRSTGSRSSPPAGPRPPATRATGQ
jgi:hypothetical protein